MSKVPGVALNTKTTIPQVGLGLWQNKNQQECEKTVEAALKAGYRHFDTAQVYGNEQFLGNALAKSDTPRNDLFITTKIWNDNQFWDDVIPSFDESLERLQTDYVDLLLVHFPVTQTRGAAWRKMEEIHKKGSAKAIGVSNYTVKHLKELLETAEVVPVMNQVELHVFLQQPELLDYCKEQGIMVEAYSPLAHGHGLEHPTLESIANKHAKTTAQVMIRWCIEIGTIPLPKTTHVNRLIENLDVFDFALSAEDMTALKQLDKNYRTCWDPTNIP